VPDTFLEKLARLKKSGPYSLQCDPRLSLPIHLSVLDGAIYIRETTEERAFDAALLQIELRDDELHRRLQDQIYEDANGCD
jgi:hypothetical protein